MSVSVFIDSCLLEFWGLLVDWASTLQDTTLSRHWLPLPLRVPRSPARSLCRASDPQSQQCPGCPTCATSKPQPNSFTPRASTPMALFRVWMKSTVTHHILALPGALPDPSLSTPLCHHQLPNLGFPGGLNGKESACNAGDSGSIPESGRFAGEGIGNPLQYSCLENPMHRGAWWATVHRVAKSWTWLKQLSMLTHLKVYILSILIRIEFKRQDQSSVAVSTHCWALTLLWPA